MKKKKENNTIPALSITFQAKGNIKHNGIFLSVFWGALVFEASWEGLNEKK